MPLTPDELEAARDLLPRLAKVLPVMERIAEREKHIGWLGLLIKNTVTTIAAILVGAGVIWAAVTGGLRNAIKALLSNQ